MAAEQSTQTTPETWKPVVGYEGYYEVSDHGRVRSVDRISKNKNGHLRRLSGQTRKTWKNKDGYPSVTLKVNGVQSNHYVHRLVLLAFVGQPPEGAEGCHNDGDRTNSHLENLRWDTRSENMYDMVRHGNHFQVSKSHCPHGHLLELPNLVAFAHRKGHRQCLACARGAAYVHRHQERRGDFQKISDSYYRVLMSPDA